MVRSPAAAFPATTNTSRHTAFVRITHWITTLCFFALLVSGIEIVISHPRFYWGETGNVFTHALFQLPIPASRSSVLTGYGYVLPDQNGWSRYLHFQSARLAVCTGLLYVAFGFFEGHFEGWSYIAEWRGVPLRMRVPRQLGYKNVKYISRLTLTHSLQRFGKGLGSAAPEGGYAWYAGI